jgi:hypothetical protein
MEREIRKNPNADSYHLPRGSGTISDRSRRVIPTEIFTLAPKPKSEEEK